MTTESGAGPELGAAAAARPGGHLLVDTDGLVGRERQTAGPINAVAPAFRGAYQLIQSNFAFIILGTIVICAIAIFIRGGATLMGEQIRTALVLGGIYALVAIGYTMVYGIIELINFAHGDVFTLSGFYAVILADTLGLGRLATSGLGGLLLALLIIFPLTMIAAGLTGMAIERVAYRRLRDAPRLAPLITAIGVSFLLQGFMLIKFGPTNVTTHMASWITGQAFKIGSVAVNWEDLFVVGMALLLMVGLGIFIRRTRLGKAMRATAQDRMAALICGINVNRTVSVTFFIGSALAGAAAIIYSTNYGSIQWSNGYRLGIIAFTAAVLGGIGNIVGAGVGGFLIGMIYVFGGTLAGGEWSEALIFAMLVLILTFRPVGLFGIDVTTRA
ncbi:MAG: branched-chain amino acid ABC transporter permease [Candidatus Dormibacteraeota bacterium]|nr:branched-chain amino acid ABC transporter permease [Candidatus Dormibacteraeota bacterium]